MTVQIGPGAFITAADISGPGYVCNWQARGYRFYRCSTCGKVWDTSEKEAPYDKNCGRKMRWVPRLSEIEYAK